MVATVAPNEVAYFGHTLIAEQPGPVVITGVTLEVEDADALRQDMWALRLADTDYTEIGAVRESELLDAFPSLARLPIERIELRPDDVSPEWQLIVELSASAPGTYTVKGLNISYETQEDVATQFLPFGMTLRVQ